MTRRGQIVIPAPIREALGFQSGDDLILTVRDGSLLVQRAGDADTEPEPWRRSHADAEPSRTGLL
jgi:AbrB family looped-hinge helix DNA binding protein